MIDCVLGDAFGVCPARFRVLFCSVCSDVDTNIKLLDHVVSQASFLIVGVFQYDIAHCQSVTVL